MTKHKRCRNCGHYLVWRSGLWEHKTRRRRKNCDNPEPEEQDKHNAGGK